MDVASLPYAGITAERFAEAHARVAAHAHRTPLLTSRALSERTGFNVGLKAEMFQRTGSYKIRGPLNKLALLSEDERARGVVCSSAGNHAQGVALAAALYGIRAVVVMAENATPSKVEATRAYGADVVLHGTIWDEANEKAQQLVDEEGLTYVHPFDDPDLIVGQGTLGLEIHDDMPDVDVVIVPIGGGGLISGVTLALKSRNARHSDRGCRIFRSSGDETVCDGRRACDSRPHRLLDRRLEGQARRRAHVRDRAALRR